MAGAGRNDPCPCGSGKKHKKCCLNKQPSFTHSEGPLQQVVKDLNPTSIAKKWLGDEPESEEGEPMQGLRLVADRFRIDDAGVVDLVRQAGSRQEGETVLFFQDSRWIGEVDLAHPGELYLVTPRQSLADHLRARLEALGGLTHLERHVDEMEAVQEAAPSTPGIEFKKTFFKQWREEANEALGGLTPRQAAADAGARPKLVKLLKKLKDKEARLPKEQRFSFTAIERSLGL